MIWHDGLDTDAVARLSGEARDEALTMLRAGIGFGDAHAAQALAAMADVGSHATLAEQIASATGSDKVRMILAAHALVPDPGHAVALAAVLRDGYHWGIRLDAARALAHFTDV